MGRLGHVVVLLVLLLPGGGLRAQGGGGELRGHRLIGLFDFEETDDRGRKLGVGLPMPRHWYAVGRDPLTRDVNFLRQPLHQMLIERQGFPAYATVGYSDRHTTSGDYSLMLEHDGGDAGAFLQVGVLPAVPGSDYLLRGRLLTESLTAATARVVISVTDNRGREIGSTVRSSRGMRTDGQWKDVEVRLPSVPPAAAWIAIRVLLEQPERRQDHPLAGQQVVLRDVAGAAWFDDLAVWQVPRLSLATQAASNLIVAPDRPRIDLRVQDLIGSQLVATSTIYDHAMRPVTTQTRPVGGREPSEWAWVPALPKYGWYLTELKVFDLADGTEAGAPLARQVGAFHWLPREPAMAAKDAERFELIATGSPPAVERLLPEVLRRTGLGAVTLSGWSADDTLTGLMLSQQRREETLATVEAEGTRVTLALWPVPAALARTPGVERARTLGVLGRDPGLWMPWVQPMLLRQGQRVRRWSLGDATGTWTTDGEDLAGLPGILDGVEGRFRDYVGSPRLVLPWDARLDLAEDLPVTTDVALRVSAGVAAAAMPEVLEPWAGSPAALTLELEGLPADEVTHARRVGDLAIKALLAWETEGVEGVNGVEGLAIRSPWALVERDGADGSGASQPITLLPDPRLGVFALLGHRLGGRRVITRLDLVPGVACLLLDGAGGPMLAVWADEPADELDDDFGDTTTVDLNLGGLPVAIDLFGNAAAVPRADTGDHRLIIPRNPVFVTGVDGDLLRFRAGFELDEPRVESTMRPQDRTLRLHNPFPRTITGSFRVVEPAGWDVQPRQHTFSIASGRTAAFPVQLRLPVSEEAGDKRVTVEVTFKSDAEYRVMLDTPAEVGLEGLALDATLAVIRGGGAEVTCLVTNTGAEPRSLFCFASAPGQPRDERPVPRLMPGETIVRTFRFPNLTADAVRCGVREMNGPGVLSKVLRVGN